MILLRDFIDFIFSQLNKLEEELTVKFDKEIKSLEKKHYESINELTTERDSLQQKLDETKLKVWLFTSEPDQNHVLILLYDSLVTILYFFVFFF